MKLGLSKNEIIQMLKWVKKKIDFWIEYWVSEEKYVTIYKKKIIVKVEFRFYEGLNHVFILKIRI